MTQWFEQQVDVPNPQGFHVRPAQLTAALAGRFRSEITIRHDDSENVNAKSIMHLLKLSGPPGMRLTIRASGEDAEEAVVALVALVQRGFDEM